MLKKLILVFISIIFFFSSHLAYGALVINEVMYDLSGSDSTNSKSREWVEIYNNGASDVLIDASTWRIYDGTANRTINGEVNFSISSGGFVIFAGDKDTFLADNSSFSGVVYDTGITTLNNTGAILKLLDQDGNIVDSFSYTSSLGGAGDGNSLQKVSSSWIGALPTPGVANETTSTPNSGSSGGSSSGSSTSSSNIIEDDTQISIKKEQKIQIKIISKNVAFSGVPVEFKFSGTGYSGDNLQYGKYFWNFGDGDSKELRVGEVDKLYHTYFYPGEYSPVLEYCMTYCESNPDAFDKIILKIVEPQVIISNVGEEPDFFIELENKGDYEADISKWVLSSEKNSFVLPRNTILSSRKKMKIPPNVSGFLSSDISSLVLMNSQRDIVHSYIISSDLSSNVSPVLQNKINKKTNYTLITQEFLKQEVSNENTTKDLSASLISSNVADTNSSSYIFGFILIIFLGATSGFVYFIRKKRLVTLPGDDFELLDE